MKLRKGQYVICKYRGDNGDLIVGRVESVRLSGDVLLTNLLTNARSVKKASVLSRRNRLATAPQVRELLATFKKHGKAETRKMAIFFGTPTPVIAEKPRKGKVVWYAKGGGIAKCGPFPDQLAATDAMRLVKKPARTHIVPDFRGGRANLSLVVDPEQRNEFPDDVFVWPERSA